MKTRHGFISNSSTSSFIIVGIDLESNNIDREEVAKRITEKFKLLSDKFSKYETPGDLYSVMRILEELKLSKVENFDENRYLGMLITSSTSDMQLEDFSMSNEELKRLFQEMKDFLSFIEYEYLPVKIYGGTQAC